MNGQLTLEKAKKVVEANIRAMGITDPSSWKTLFYTIGVDGQVTGTQLYPGLPSFRDFIAKSIVDILTNASVTGNITTNSDGTNSTPPNLTADMTKIHLEVTGAIELKGSEVDVNPP